MRQARAAIGDGMSIISAAWHDMIESSRNDQDVSDRRPCELEFRGGPRVRDHHRHSYKGLSHKGYVHHASEEDPQYEIKSDKTDHVAAHKGSALKYVRGKGKT